MEDLIAIIVFSILMGLIIYFYIKNKKEGKDDYSGFNDGSGNNHLVK
jgi:Na+/H+-dicarboxylate symporter